MLRFLPLMTAAALLIGCAGEVNNPFSDSGANINEAQAAAFAASHEYPADVEASNELPLTVLISRGDGEIQVINASDQAIRDGIVWVNGSFAAELENLPANGTVTLPRDAFFDRSGARLSNVQTSANRVQLQIDDRLHNLQGPVFER